MLGENLVVKILAIAIVTLLIGISLGYIITVNTVTPSDEDDNELEENKVILNEEESEDHTWDPSHHILISEDGKMTGRVIMIEKFVEDERDQYHFLVLPDLEYRNMVNDANTNDLRGAMMVEIAKSDEYILPRLYIGQHLEIQGPHVTDTNHGWNEIDPVRVIIEL